MDSIEHEWELSKENVQPLRQGRRMSSLVAALNPDQSEEHNIKTQQNEFESELRTYSGDDPYNVWDRYIKWTEQHFPKGGHDGQLMKLIERCLREFQADQRYTNDQRFIKMWIKFACFSEEPTIIYSYMFDNGIGDKAAALYVEWALSLERSGDMKKADTIYTEGLNRAAVPRDLLLHRHQQFQNRVARNISLQIAESQTLNVGVNIGEEEPQRSALGRLKGLGPSQKVGTTRTGTVKLGSAGTLKDNRPVVSKQKQSSGIPVFVDVENLPPNLQPQQTKEWQSLPMRAVDNRENDKNPGVWTGAKVKQKTDTVSTSAGISIDIYKDPESETAPLESPRKTALFNTQPLSSRKAGQTDVLSNLRQQQGGCSSVSEIPMYQKAQVYNGICEFSFEELRAAKYWKLRKEKEAQEERLKQEEERRQREDMIMRQLQETTDKMAALEALFQNRMGDFNLNRFANKDQAELPHPQLELQQGPIQACGQQQLCPEEAVNPSVSQLGTEVAVPNTAVNFDFVTPTNDLLHLKQAKGNGSSGPHSIKQKAPIFNSMASYGKLSSGCSLLSSSSSFNSSMKSESLSATTPVDSSSAITTPVSTTSSLESSSAMQNLASHPVMASTCTLMDGHQSTSVSFRQDKVNDTVTPRSKAPILDGLENSTVKKVPLTAPSPTVYTKEALQCVMGMFSSSFACDSQPMTEEVESFIAPTLASCPPVPFAICTDTTEVLNTETVTQKVEHPIFSDPVEKVEHPIFSDPVEKVQHPIFSDPVEKVQHPIFSGPVEKQEIVKVSITKKGVRRALGFLLTSATEDVEMTDMDRDYQPMNNDFTIECQAKNDLTLAPLDSFSIQARAASTPYADAHKTSNVNDVSSCSASSATVTSLAEMVPTPSKHLSPIFEGSGESSSEESKSSYQPSTSRHGRPHLQQGRDVSMHDDQLLDTSCQHQIDTSTFVPRPEDDKKNVLSTSVCLNPADPFDEKTIAVFLKTLNPPITQYLNYIACDGQMPDLDVEFYFSLGNRFIVIDKCIGQGGYAKIYKIVEHSDVEDTMSLEIGSVSSPTLEKAIKVQSPPCYWEFYVSCELKKRLLSLAAYMDVTPSILQFERGFFFDNASALQMTLVPCGSLLNLVNHYKSERRLLAGVEPFACLLTIELLHLFEQIHKCGFIHGDVKPDNFLVLDLPYIKQSQTPEGVFGTKLRLVQLIDFGQSIDLSKFPQGTTFMAKVVTSGFQCIEMRTNKPWTFQTDLFGLAGTVHVVLFGTYMNVFHQQGVWKITGSFVRKWNVSLWKQLFNVLLNIPSCEQQPDLASLRHQFEQYFLQNLIPAYNAWIQDVQYNQLL